MPNVYLYNPFKSDCIESLIDSWVNTEIERGWKKELVRVRHGQDKPLGVVGPKDTLYIIGHGDVQANRICDRTSIDEGAPEILHPQDLAARLVTDGLKDRSFTIKIYSCLAARGFMDSFAANAAQQIKLKVGSLGGLSCKFTIYGYNEIVSILVKHPQTGEYGKFVGELKEDVTGAGADTIEITQARASTSKKLLVSPGF
ncbi:MAG: hypothetical protein EOO71_11555 [Myxococcaceae bacterium]|nr:MAG: hypothetical protein EOO71_11555 [Myxococcaceae bacterium]